MEGEADLVETQAHPELVADMDRPGLTMTLCRYPIGIDEDVPARSLGICRIGPPPPSGFLDHAVDNGAVAFEHVMLAGDRSPERGGAPHPLTARGRTQIAERADGPLARALRRPHRHDQLKVDVGPALDRACCAAEIHITLHIRIRSASKVENSLVSG